VSRLNRILLFRPSRFWSYGVAVLSCIATAIISQWLAPHIGFLGTPFLCVVALSGWYGGVGPCLLATVLSSLAFHHHMLQPIHAMGQNAPVTPRLLMYIVSNLLIGLLSAAQRKAKESIILARDDLKLMVQDLRRTNEALHAESRERKQAGEALRRNESYLAEAQRLTHTGSGAWSVPGWDALYLSEEWYRIYGFDPKQGLSAWKERLQRIHPEDQAKVQEAKDRATNEKSDYEVDHRIVLPDGTVKYTHTVGHPILNASGEVEQFVCTMMDVTKRKQAEEALQKAFDEIKGLRDQLYQENIALKEEVDLASMFEEIVGTSPALRAVLSRVSKVAPTDSTVLITGETGTGKELIARAVHKRSQRSSRAFVSVNCAAIPRDLIASELFGHEKGAFTGATQRRLGRFELAEGGTIFLDEIGELPAETQIALLRVLQEREFERVGGTGSIRTNVRVIAATNRELQAAIAGHTFRSDLFYRLNVFPIEIPALRERREDIRVLVEYFIDRYARKAGKRILGINKKSLELLESYPWPGNIRELQNVIERSVIVCETENFSVDASWLFRPPTATGPSVELGLSKKLPSSEEKAIIEAALTECHGQVSGPSGAAAKLGIPGSTLESKIKSLQIDKNRFKSTYGPV
jgi:PAS domain S-box-containing protein